MHKKLKARILSLALSVAMVTTMIPTTVFAAEGGNVTPGASSVGTIQSFDKLEDRFIPSTGENAPDHVYGLSVALDTPAEDIQLPTELTAMVARTTVTTPEQDKPVVDSGKPSEPAVDETIPDEDDTAPDDTATDNTVSGNQPASPSDAQEEVKEEIKDEDVPLAPEPEDKETIVTTTRRESIPVEWTSDKEYKSDENGKFVYTAVLPEGYILADGVKLPQIYVFVGKQARASAAAEIIVGGVGNTEYPATAEGLQKAFDNISAGGTVKLGADINLGTTGITLSGNNAVTLDLNGFKVAFSGDSGTQAILHSGGASLTIADTSSGGQGELSATGDSGTAIYNESTGAVTVSGGSVSAGDGGQAILNESTGTVTVSGGSVSAGDGGQAIYNQSTGAVTVSSGSVSATGSNGYVILNQSTGTVTVSGGSVSAGDGGQAIYNYSTGAVTVSGGSVSATTSVAIYNNSTGAVTVSGGSVLATAGVAIYNKSTGKIIVSGSAEVTSANTKSKSGTIHLGQVSTSGSKLLLEVKDTAKVTNTANPAGYSVYFVSSDVTASNVASYYSKAAGATVGKVYPEAAASLAHDISTGSLTLSTGDGCSASTPHVVTGTTTSNTITVASGGTHFVTLDNVSISTTKAGGPFAINAGVVNLTLTGANTLTAQNADDGEGHPGLLVKSGASLTIDGTGSLNSTGYKNSMMGAYGAGIGGGGSVPNAGTISIQGGTITATGGYGIGPGIFGATHGTAEALTIRGADTVVTATSLAATAAIAANTLTLTGMEAKYKTSDGTYTGTTNVSNNKIYEGTTQTTVAKDIKVTASTGLPDYTGTQAAAPSGTPASKTATAITLAAVTVSGETIEYAKSTSSTAPTSDSDWQPSTAFTGLTADTQYYFFARVKANTSHKAGAASAGTAIKTDKTDAQKVAAAKPLAETAITNLTATNSTTAASILSTVNTAIGSVSGVTATWKAGSPTIIAATDSAAGSITGTIVLTCGTETVEVAVSKTIAQLGSDAEKVANAKAAAVAALNGYTATNSTSATDVMTLVNNAITAAGVTGVTAEWKYSSGFDKTNATNAASGSIGGTITLKLNSAEQDVVINLTIAKLTTLSDAITAANAAKNGITVNNASSPSSVTNGTKYVSEAEMKALNDAIAAAQVVLNNPSATEAEVTAAVTALNNAVNTFKAAIKTGTYSGGGGGGSSSDNNNNNATIVPPTNDKPNDPTTAEVKTPATVDSKGNATVIITEKNMTDAVDKALSEAKKNGTQANGVSVQFVVSTGGKAVNSLSVNLPKVTQEKAIAGKVQDMSIILEGTNITVGFNLAAVTEINKQAQADVQLTTTRMDNTKLSAEAKAAIGSRPVFDVSATYANGTKKVDNLGNGQMRIEIPYKLQSGEVAGNLYGVYVDGNGKVTYLTNSSYDAKREVLIIGTNHNSVYGVGYKSAAPAFTDITNHWAKDSIEFVAARGLLNGTSGTTFSPNTTMTRGMFMTALGRLAGVDTNSYKNGKFTDVAANVYYAPYVNWAAEKGIVSGTSATTFAPDAAITREQMAVIMQNYAKVMGYTVPKTREAVAFTDAASIGAYAKDAVKAMQMAGIINGKNNNTFDPQASATRAEVAAVLHRYVELVIDRATAQGLDTNDSGSAVMYESGKMVKSSSRKVGDNTYNFNSNGEAALPPADSKKTGTYTVQKGDSFSRIASKVGCTIAELEQLNGKSRYDIIYTGQVLKVPQK